MMIEIVNVDQKEVTNQEAAEAINTIKRYWDCRYCCDCTIRKICQEYFDNSDAYPDDWPDLCAD